MPERKLCAGGAIPAGAQLFVDSLELLVEAQEAGNEEDVDSLQHFFSDQAKFPAEVVAKYDPNDGTTACLHIPAEKRNADSRFLVACN